MKKTHKGEEEVEAEGEVDLSSLSATEVSYYYRKQITVQFFARFIALYKECWVNYTWSFYFPVFLINIVHHYLKNRNSAAES